MGIVIPSLLLSYEWREMKLLPAVIDYNKICYCSGMGYIEKNILGSLSEVYWGLLQAVQKSTEDSCILGKTNLAIKSFMEFASVI